jgi:hypothetical protein
MIRVRVDDVMAQKPCPAYDRARVEGLWSGRDSLDATDIAALDIPAKDRLWAVLRCCLDARTQRLFACDCAERALERERTAGREPDARSWAAVKVSRRYAVEYATEQELGAAYSAAYSTANAATHIAAADATYAAAAAAFAANAAAYAAAGFSAHADSERAWQLDRAVYYALEVEK